MAQVRGDDGTASGLPPGPPPTINQIFPYGVWGDSERGYGVTGTSKQSNGVNGASVDGIGVNGWSFGNTGVHGSSGKAGQRVGEFGITEGGIGVHGENDELGGIGVRGRANGESCVGISGIADGQGGIGVSGSGGALGVSGIGVGTGVYGSSGRGSGVFGLSQDGDGVNGQSNNRYGVSGLGGDIGVHAQNLTVRGHVAYLATRGLAADFYGDVYIHGRLTKAGGGSFQIDHPLDPANKYLSHSFVESPDMKNIYDGVAILGANGEATVGLPDWFDALNKDLRYQLTAIGAPGPNLCIAEEIANGCFKIAGGSPGAKVSWQVTGIRKDAWANMHRIQVEEEKPVAERGRYLHPDLHHESSEKSVAGARYPEWMSCG